MLSPPLRPVSPASPSLAPAFKLDKEKARRKKKPHSNKKTKTVTELSSTPFHVRFGKMSVMRPAERRVRVRCVRLAGWLAGSAPLCVAR